MKTIYSLYVVNITVLLESYCSDNKDTYLSEQNNMFNWTPQSESLFVYDYLYRSLQ